VIDVSQAAVAALVENYHQALGNAKTAELDRVVLGGATYSASSPGTGMTPKGDSIPPKSAK
jgi:hypothetical protein